MASWRLTPAARLFSLRVHIYDTMALSSDDIDPSKVTRGAGSLMSWSPPACAVGGWFSSVSIMAYVSDDDTGVGRWF